MLRKRGFVMNAPDKAKEIKGAIAGILALLTALWGWVGWAAFVWIGCVALDYFSGSAAARAKGEWSSAEARAGLWHKLGEIFAVLVAALCDIALSVITSGAGIDLPIEVGPLVTPVVLLWYIITELGSIIENAGKLGAPIPKFLQKSLQDYKEKLDPAENVSNVDTAEDDYQGKHQSDPVELYERIEKEWYDVLGKPPDDGDI